MRKLFPEPQQQFYAEPNGIPADPFNGYFESQQKIELLPILQQNRMAQRWLNDINATTNNGLYTFQQATQSKPGPQVQINNRPVYQLSSYDYLGLNGHPAIEQAAVEAVHHYGTSTGGARLLSGSIDMHTELEHDIASFIGTGAALTFTSGYMANLAVISALMQRTDRVIVDEYAHRSIIDALSMAKINVEKFAHNDTNALEKLLQTESPDRGKTFVIVEGIYSMDGDICNLPKILELKYKYNFFILLDESHSFGCLGPNGRGVCEHYGINPREVDVFTSSLYKSIPAGGGFIAASQQVIIYLQHGASPYMFSAALQPASVGAALAALQLVKQNGKELIAKLHSNAAYLRAGLKSMGYDTGNSETAIIPVIIGDKMATLTLSAKLYELGFLATPVVFPAVPPGGDRLRLCVTSGHTRQMLDEVIDAFKQCQQGVLKDKKAA
jgi:8-amino-7-oxononanoate synthase